MTTCEQLNFAAAFTAHLQPQQKGSQSRSKEGQGSQPLQCSLIIKTTRLSVCIYTAVRPPDRVGGEEKWGKTVRICELYLQLAFAVCSGVLRQDQKLKVRTAQHHEDDQRRMSSEQVQRWHIHDDGTTQRSM